MVVDTNTKLGVEKMKGLQKVAKNQNGAGTRSVSTSIGANNRATKGAKKNMKVVARNSIATKRKQYGSTKCGKSQSDSRTMEEANQSLQGRAITLLSDRDWDQLMESINNPRGPSPELIEMCKKYA